MVLSQGSDHHADRPTVQPRPAVPGDDAGPYQIRLIRNLTIMFGLLAVLSALLGLIGMRLGITILSSVYPGYRTIALSAALIWIVTGAILAINASRPLRGMAAVAAKGLLAAIVALAAFELPLSLLGTHSVIEIWLTGLGAGVFGPSSNPISPAASALIIPLAAALFLIAGIPARSPGNRRIRNAAGIAGSVVALASFTFVVSYIFGNPLLYGTQVIPIAALSALAALFSGAGLIFAAGPDAIPLRYVTGTSTRALLFRTFIPLTVAIIFIQQVIFFAISSTDPGRNAVLIAGSLVLFALATAYAVSRVSGKIGTALERAGQKLLQKNEELSELNEELTAADEELRQNNAELFRSEQQLRESELRYRTVADFTLDWEFWFDPEGKFLYVSPSADRILGRPAGKFSEVVPFLREVVHPADLPALLAHFRDELAGKGPSELEFRIVRPDGEVRWIHHVCRPIHDPDGKFLGTRGSNRDITEHRRAEEALRRSEEKYRIIVETANEGIWIHDTDRRTILVNQRMADMLGYPVSEIMGRTPSDFLHPDQEQIRAKTLKDLETGVSTSREFRFRRRDGSDLWVISNASPVFDNEGRLLRTVSLLTDITDRKQAEESLRKAYDELELRIQERTAALKQALSYNRSLIEAGIDPLVTIRPDGTIGDVNTATVRVTGFSREELIGTDFSEYFTDPAKAKAGYEAVFRDGFVRDYALEIRHREGRVTPVLYNATVFHDESGKITGVFAAARDITELKKAEDLIRKLAAIVETTDDAVIGKSLDGTVTSWNAGAENLYGYSASEALGRSISFLLPAGGVDDLDIILQNVRKGRPVFRHETTRRRKDGRLVDVAVTVSPIKDRTGAVIGASTIARDITDRKKAEAAIRQAFAYNRSLIEASLDPLVTINPDGKISDVNAATMNATGFTREELVGTDFSEYFTEPDKAEAGYQTVFRDGFVRDYPLEIRHRDGRVIPVMYNATIFHDEFGKAAGVFAAARDISTLKQAEKAIIQAHSETRVERQRLYEVLETLPVYVCLLDKEYKMPFANRYFRETFGYSLIRPCYAFLFDRNEPCENCDTYTVMKTHAPHHWYWTGPNGRDYDIYDFPFTDTDGSLLILEMGIDITEQKKAEEALKKAKEILEVRVGERTAELAGTNEELRAANEELSAAQEELSQNIEEMSKSEELLKRNAAELTEALAEKEMLLSEIHHRVKNNLTAFISLLSLEGSYEESEAGIQLKKDLQNRARSMALIHETLYRTKKYSHVDMGIYLNTLLGQIATSYTIRRDIQISVSADGAILDLARATPCGLIINELVTNSFKYAFPPGHDCMSTRGQPCMISVSLTETDGMYRLIVSDNGIGLPEGVRLETAKSLGLKLVNFLARHQLRAAILVDTSRGTSVEFQFSREAGFS